MAQSPKKKKREKLLPEGITERPDREIMEAIFGKQVMAKVDRFVTETDSKRSNSSMT